MSSRFPDPDTSRAVLIGASRYINGAALPNIPAVERNLIALEAALTDAPTGTLASQHCTVVSEPTSTAEFGGAIATAAAEATDLLLIYYSGHGLVDDRGRLHLALSSTDPARPRWTALPFEVLREEIMSSPATTRVLVLDCCFSGRAIEAMADQQGVITGQIDVAGTYTLTSTAANALAHAPVGATHTAFTGALLATLSAPGPLTLDDLFQRVDRHLMANAHPRPQRRAVNAAGDLALFKSSPDGPVPDQWPPEPRKPAPQRSPVGQITVPGRLLVAAYLAVLLAASNVFVGADVWFPTQVRPPEYLPFTPPPIPRLAGSRDIAEAMSNSYRGLAWSFTAYMLAFGVTTALGEVYADRVSRRLKLAAGIAVYTTGTALCVFSSVEFDIFIWARAVQAAGAGLIYPQSLAYITGPVSAGQRRTETVIWNVAVAAVCVLGPLVDNTIAEVSSWEWVFLGQVPLGLLAFLLVFGRLPEHQKYIRAGHSVDLSGFILIATGLLALGLGAVILELGSEVSKASFAPLVAGFVLIGAFTARKFFSSDISDHDKRPEPGAQ
ncbi:caspase, EACC1-associated type [Nocardia nepalensis]|uniref:caspase, EACC1-associated type n=1 Tax=Nocardia nepalensis TaxID=3375448 RepID=UPI003B67D62C